VIQVSETLQKPLTKKGELTKKKILETALVVFGENGYFESSIVEITLKAGVAQGTFYNYFPTKKAIYDELIYELSADLRQHIKKAIDEEKQQSFYKRQQVGFQAFFQWVLSKPNLYSVVQQSVLVDKDLYRWYYEKLALGFINSIEQGIANGECKNINAETIAYCLMGIGQFIGMRHCYWENEEVPPEVMQEMMDFVLKGIHV
jgi:AcrR family transcriptional regulator